MNTLTSGCCHLLLLPTPFALFTTPSPKTPTLQVPADAHVLDVVFNDGENSTFFDNNGGLDYHIPVEGGKGVMPGLKVRMWYIWWGAAFGGEGFWGVTEDDQGSGAMHEHKSLVCAGWNIKWPLTSSNIAHLETCLPLPLPPSYPLLLPLSKNLGCAHCC